MESAVAREEHAGTVARSRFTVHSSSQALHRRSHIIIWPVGILQPGEGAALPQNCVSDHQRVIHPSLIGQFRIAHLLCRSRLPSYGDESITARDLEYLSWHVFNATVGSTCIKTVPSEFPLKFAPSFSRTPVVIYLVTSYVQLLISFRTRDILMIQPLNIWRDAMIFPLRYMPMQSAQK